MTSPCICDGNGSNECHEVTTYLGSASAIGSPIQKTSTSRALRLCSRSSLRPTTQKSGPSATSQSETATREGQCVAAQVLSSFTFRRVLLRAATTDDVLTDDERRMIGVTR